MGRTKAQSKPQQSLSDSQRLEDINAYLPTKCSILIGFSTTSTCLSRFIRWATKASVSHTWVSFMGQEKRWVIGSEENGLTRCPWNEFVNENTVKAVFVSTHKDIRQATNQFAIQYREAPYDWGAAGTLGLQARCSCLWSLCGGWLREKLVRESRLMCVEVPIRILQAADCPMAATLDPETTNSQQLMYDIMINTVNHLFEAVYVAEDHMEALVNRRKSTMTGY